VCLPEEFFSPAPKPTDNLLLCKSQLVQILNYIKLNPSNKYQHFSKVLTKRLPATNLLAGLLLEKTATCVINWINEGTPVLIQERLSFYDKMREITVLLRKEEGPLPAVDELPSGFALYRQDRSKKSELKPKTDRTPVAAFDEESELDYCRSFERKTHKYSINDVYDQHDSPFEEPSGIRDASNTPSPVTHFPNDKPTSRER
jgi:hypothetical protein